MIAIRAAHPDDFDAYLRLFAELGVPDPIPSRETFVDKIAPRMISAVVGGAVVGYATWRTYGPLVHVVNVAVDPAQRGRRIGQVLLEDIRDRARAMGCTRWYLNVKSDNTPALRLYERCGFQRDLAAWVLTLAWADARTLPAAASVSAQIAEPALDAAISERYGVPVDRLALVRGRAATTMLALVEAGDPRPAGFAAFDRTYPGCAVFATSRPALAGALLAACDAHADHAQFDFLRLTVERDEALATALIAAGASVMFTVEQLSAPLDSGTSAQ